MTAARPYHSPVRQARRQQTKQAIVDAFIAQLGVEARLFAHPPRLPRTAAELPDLVTAVYQAAEGHLPLLRAMVNSRMGTRVRGRRRAGRLAAIAKALEAIGADPAQTRRAVAVVSVLASADAGIVLADQYGLTLQGADRACAEATRAIVDSLSAQAARTAAGG